LELLSPVRSDIRRLGILAGAFNPPTVAHLALADAALARVDHVLLVMPSQFPHKGWEGASREHRVEMLRAVSGERITAAISEGGLFLDMAREARVLFPEAEVHVVCGRDAAERLIGWHAGEPEFFDAMCREFRLLVAGRRGVWEPDSRVAEVVEMLDAGPGWDEVSSTAVRESLAAGTGEWRALVPEVLHGVVERVYG
jgi:nicotinate-nucleotide adenylyltransferase